MRRPGWVTAIGVIGIILGCLGILGGLLAAISPATRGFFEEFINNPPAGTEIPASTYDQFDKWLAMPDWYNPWLIISGVVAIAISVFFIIASVSMLKLKQKAVTMFYSAVGLCAAFLIVRTIVNNIASSSGSISGIFGLVFRIAIFAIITAVVAKCDKSAFVAGSSNIE